LGRIVLSDAAVRRLVHYCRRAASTSPDFVEMRGEGVMDGRHVRYVGADLRRVVWRDVEVRDALLAAEERAVWEAPLEVLAARGARSQGLSLLDLVTAMSLERAAAAGSTTDGEDLMPDLEVAVAAIANEVATERPCRSISA
jgi:hypothetical protein